MRDALVALADAIRAQTKEAATWHRETQEAAERRHRESLDYYAQVEAARRDQTIADLEARIRALEATIQQQDAVLSQVATAAMTSKEVEP